MTEFINLDKDKIIGNKNCSVNKRGIHSNEYVTVFRCNCSVDKDILICFDCKNKCHREHENEVLDKRKAKDFICSCAISNHNPNQGINQNKENPSEKINNQNAKETSCNLVNYYEYMDYNYIFEKKSDNKVYCVHCAYTCTENSTNKTKDDNIINKMEIDNKIPNEDDDDDNEEKDQDMEKIDEEKIFHEKKDAKFLKTEMEEILKNDYNKIKNDRNRACQCVNEKFHSSISKNLGNLATVIRKGNFNYLGINLNKFCYRIFDSNCDLYSEITSEFISKNNQIRSALKENRTIEDEKWPKEHTFIEEYLNLSNLIETVCNYYKSANVDLESIIKKDIFKSIDIDLLTKLFKNDNCIESKCLVIMRMQSLRIFRKFYLNPKINCKNYYSDQIDLNTTPIHRKITSRNISSDLFQDIGITKDIFTNFLKTVGEKILDYFRDSNSSSKFSHEIFKLYTEYIHLLNVIIKYRLDNFEIIDQNLNIINDILKNLINNQQNNKIYFIKKQLLRFLNKLLIKINDEKFFDYLNDQINEKYDNPKFSFCFQNSERNYKIFQIFLMINQKYAHQSRDIISNYQIEYFLDLMMLKEDGYINSLDVIANNKKFSVNIDNYKSDIDSVSDPFIKNILSSIKKEIDLATEHSKKLFTQESEIISDSTEMSYVHKIKEHMLTINSKFKELEEKDKKDNREFLKKVQNILYANGYSKKMLHILINLGNINKSITIEELVKVYDIIFNNLLLFTKDNPFLAFLPITNEFAKILFYNEPQYNKILFKFYKRIIKTLHAYSYKIDPTSFIDNFITHFCKYNKFNIESTENYEDLFYIGSFFDNLIAVCNAKKIPVIIQTISEQIKNIFSSKHFCDNVKRVVEKLKQDYMVCNLPDNDQFIIKAFKNFLKILNHISDGHFVATISRMNIEVSSEIIESMLHIKYIHPSLRRTLICFYTKNRIQLPYKIHKSTEFNYQLFTGMMENISKMNSLYDVDLGEEDKEEKQVNRFTEVTNELKIYPNNLEKYNEYFLNHKSAFFKYFAEAIFFPCVNSMYTIHYFNEKLKSKLKYLIYTIFVLFCKCFKRFLEKLNEYGFYDSTLFNDYLGFNLNDNLKVKCEIIKNKLEADLTELEGDTFLIKDNNVFQKFIYYLECYFLKDKIRINSDDNSLDKDENTVGEKKTGSNQMYKNSKDMMEQISQFIKKYNEKKKRENNNNLIFCSIFADEQTFNKKYSGLEYLKTDTDNKLRNEFKKSLFLMLLDNMIDNDRNNVDLSYEYNEKNYYCLKKLVKIFKLDPSFCQSFLLEEKRDDSKKILEEMIKKNLICLFQIVFVEYNTINSIEAKSTYRNITKIIEFIRLHCEDHNRIFQTYFCYYNIISKNEGEKKETYEIFYFIKFILKIFLLIYNFVTYKIKKKYLFLEFSGIKKIRYFDKLLEKIVELLVEVYQGNHKENYIVLVGDSYDFGEFLDVFLKTFDDIQNVTEIEIIVMHFMTFYLSLLEDYDMTDDSKNKITKKLNLKLILSTITYSLKKCEQKYCVDKTTSDELEKTSNTCLKKGSGEELLEVYKLKSEFAKDHLFKLVSKCYLLLKILADLNNSKAIDVLNNLKDVNSNIKELTKNEKDRNNEYHTQKSEVYIFCSKIIKNVEINFSRTKSSSIKDEKYLADMDQKILNSIDVSENNGNKLSEDQENLIIKPVNFLIHSDSLYLTEKDLESFRDQIEIDNYNKKLLDLVSKNKDIIKTIEFKKRIHGYDKIIQFLSSLNYKYFEIISILIVLVINLMMQWTMTLDEIAGTDPYHSSIIYLSIANLIFLGLIITNYMVFKYIYLSSNEKENPGLFNYLSFLFSDEIFALVWNFIIGVAAIVSPYANFLFSLQLFSIISLFETMKTILITIQKRWKQFTSTAILIVILIMFYTGISFYFIRKYYVLQDIQLNVCSNYVYCFFSIFSYGMRLGGGIGDLIGLVKYDDPLFWGLFIFQWVFYFTIVLIMLNVINGIIVDTFQDLREKNNKRKDIKENQCYICAIDRINFQINSLDFVAHQEFEHNLYNYILYLINIHKIDEHDLNSVDYQSKLCCDNQQTSFFPIKKSIALKNKENQS